MSDGVQTNGLRNCLERRSLRNLNRQNFVLTCLSLCLLLTGCKTPPEVKQALVSLDRGYAENVKLMRGYQQLSDSFKERHKYWSLYVKEREKLDLALRWATTTPQPPDVSLSAYAELSRHILGTNTVSLVNQFRLKGLAPCAGQDGKDIFTHGTNTIDALIQALPALVNAVTAQSAAEYAATVKSDTSVFDDYVAKVSALQRINDAIKRYLDIDVTVKPQDVQTIAGSIQTLSGK